MISISSIDYSDDDHVLIDDTLADYRVNTARVARVKTLDGGVHIGLSGVSDGDRTLSVAAVVSGADGATLWAIFRAGRQVHVSTPDGFYIAVIQALQINNGYANITIFVKSKEA